MHARRTAALTAALVAAAHLTAQSGPTIDLGKVRPGATLTRTLTVANNCDSAKVVAISHNVPHLSIPSTLTLSPGTSAIEVSLAVPATASGVIRGTVTLTFAGDGTCQPRSGTLQISATIDGAGAGIGKTPQSESWYDDATGAFDAGRELADEAQNRGGRDPEKARELARQALDRLKAASDAVTAGEASGEIGTETASVLRQAIADAIDNAMEVLDGDADDPRDEPPPIIYGEELDNDVESYDGAFEPTQGVWQDDEDFDDFPGKQLTKVAPAHLKAELKMIVRRPAFLIGVRGSRDEIYFTGTARGSKDVPVKARFTLVQAGGETILHETRELASRVPLDGVAGASKPFRVTVPATNGVPSGKPFRRFQPGWYQIVGELIRTDTNAPTGIRVTVEGEAVETTTPTVVFVPVTLNPWGRQTISDLERRTAQLAEDAKADVPAIFPMKPHSLVTFTQPNQDLSDLSRDVRRRARELGVIDVERARRDVLAATLAERFGTISALGGYGRIFLVLNDRDFDDTWQGTAAGGDVNAAAYAASRKVMAGRAGISTMVVAHEIVHTLPYIWADKAMLALFQKNWHNKTDRIAHGIEANGLRRDKSRAVMGPSGGAPWITQGTYWHLIDLLHAPVDPELLLVRGLIARVNNGYRATLSPGYQLLGDADLTAGAPARSDFAIVVRDARGAKLAEYPFDPVWEQPDLPQPRQIVSFAHRVPDMPGAASVAVAAPGGAVLATRRLSARAPALRVLTPAPEASAALANGRLRITWEASDADGDALLFNVLYSSDNGRRWQVVSHEQTGTSFELPLRGRPTQARVKIVATDGMRSVEREVRFSVQRE